MADALNSVDRDARANQNSDENFVDNLIANLDDDLQGGGSSGGGQGGDGQGTGDATLLQVYAAKVKDRIKRNWRYPAMGQSQDLTATVEVRISDDGQVQKAILIKESGKEDFDTSVLRAVRETENLPKPPEASLKVLQINFNLRELGS